MERKVIPDAENRLLILYALDRLGPVTDGQLLEFMMDQSLMNYFTLQPALVEMEQQGQLVRQLHPIGTLVSLSENGRYSLQSFASRIPQSRRETVDQAAEQWRSVFRLQQQTPAERSRMDDGRECLHLRMLESDCLLLDVTLVLPDSMRLDCLSERWARSAAVFYRDLTLLLLTDAEPVRTELPEQARLERTEPETWLLSLYDADDASPMTLLLLLRDENLARSAAQRFADNAEALKNGLLRALTDAKTNISF